MENICTGCGKDNEDGASFCNSCGASMAEASAETPDRSTRLVTRAPESSTDSDYFEHPIQPIKSNPPARHPQRPAWLDRQETPQPYEDGPPQYGPPHHAPIHQTTTVIVKNKSSAGGCLAALIILIIIAIISCAIINSQFSHSSVNLERSTCQDNIRSIDSAITAYYAATGSYPNLINDLVPDYLPSMPTCPEGGSYTLTDSSPPDVACSNGHTY